MGEFADLGRRIAELAALNDSNDFNDAGAAEGGNSASPEDYAGRYDDLEGLFGAFDDIPKPADFTGMLTGADALIEKLSRGERPEGEVGEDLPSYANPALDLFDGVKAYVFLWEGDAAESFHDRFLKHANTYTQNQYLVATVLRGALKCESELWNNVALSVRDIGEKTISALEDYDGGKSGVNWSFKIGVLGTVIGAAGAGPIGLLAAALGVFSSAAGLDLSADTPQDIAQKAREGITKVKTDVEGEEEKVHEALSKTNSYVTANRVADFVGDPLAWDLIDADPSKAGDPAVIGGRR